MTNEILKEFSEELKAVREKKKISLEQIFNKTRIDIKYLEGLEAGNFSLMPDVYIRAFLKEYAEFIGLNAGEVLENYKLAKEGKPYKEKETEPEAKEINKEEEKTEQAEETKPKFISEDLETNKDDIFKTSSHKPIYFIFAAIALMLFTYFIYDTFVAEKSKNNVKEKPFVEVLKANKEGKTVKVIKNNNKNIEVDNIKIKNIEPIRISKENSSVDKTIQNKNNLILTIVGNDKSWMRVIVDDNSNNEFIIDDGVKKQLSAKEKFYVHIGNSAGVTLYLNGKELSFSKAEGRVRKFNITKNGIQLIKRKPVQQYEYEY